MIRIFKTIDGKIHQVEEASEGCWLALTDPTATEIFEVARKYHIEVDDLRAPLDEEERSRIEVEDDYTLIIVDTPILEERGEKDWYGTIPLSIIVTDEIIITVCLEDTSVLGRFMDGRVRNFYTYMKTRFILQILYKNASMFLHYLRIIDKKSEEVEEKLQESTKNKELIELLELEKSLETMIRIFKTIDGKIHQVEEASEGCWLALTDPTATEIFEVARKYHIEVDDLRAPLDEEERSRIEVEDDYTLIIVDTPILEERGEKDWYGTIPLSIIVTDEIIITVCLEDTSVLGRFMDGRVRNFYTYMKTRFILQILYKNASMFLHYLRIIDKKSEEVEEKLQESTKNKELIELLELEKSLVYFTTSLRSNEMVLEKLLKVERIKQYPDDTDLLEDVIIENKQAIEMANVYSGILSGMTEAFASIVSNNLNIVMKFLATVTIVMSIPTMIFSAYGMNVNLKGMPFASHPEGFAIVIILSLLLSLIVAFIFSKKNLF